MKIPLTDDEKMDLMMLEYRRKRFAVEVIKDRHLADGICLSVTSNGNQWQTIRLMREEIPRVIAALQERLKEAK